MFAVVLLSRQTLNFREGEGRVEACVLIHISQHCEHQQEQIYKVREEENHLYLHFQWLGSVSFSPELLVAVTGLLATTQDPAEGL